VKIVVTGSRGLLGSEIMRFFGAREAAIGWSGGGHEGYRRVDITNQKDIDHGLDIDRPDIVIHCAANPNVASCEADPRAARELNALAVKKITSATKTRNISLVFISTDYVFSGDKESGYAEEDEPSPLQVYGRTKAEGEIYCLDLPGGLVVRLPLLFGIGHVLTKTTFPEQVVRSLRAGEEVLADAVEIRQPTLTIDVAEVLYKLVKTRIRGIVHVAPQQGITKYEWAIYIAERAALDPSLIRQTRPKQDIRRPLRSWLLDRRLQELQVSPPRIVQASTDAFFHEAELL